jgi:hypothetical protein
MISLKDECLMVLVLKGTIYSMSKWSSNKSWKTSYNFKWTPQNLMLLGARRIIHNRILIFNEYVTYIMHAASIRVIGIFLIGFSKRNV